MAKPSVTNIRPPSQTQVWTPPKTTWNLDTDWALAELNGFAADAGDTGYDGLTQKVNLAEPSPLDLELGDLNGANYDYVFFGVNGGYDETVVGKKAAAGIIVTGNGMDNITGGDLGDLIFAGNGKDVVNAGAGNDIVFGENGADQMNAGSDTGTASITVTPPEPGQNPPTVDLADYTPSEDDGTILAGDGKFKPNGDYQDNQGSLQKVGIATEVGDFYQVFAFDPGDLDPALVLNSVTISAYIYGPGFSGPPVFINTWTLNENQQVSFSVDMNDHPAGGVVVVFQGTPGTITQDQFDNPNGPASLKTQAFDGYDDSSGGQGQTIYSFEAGDQLIGGNGPDQFIWDGNDVNNVDLIWDYNQGDGTYNALEGDTLIIKNTGLALGDLVTTTTLDLDNDATTTDLVIYIGENQAIGLVGIDDISKVNIVFQG
jgi:Ca2+-binding RTX toxin-like protein